LTTANEPPWGLLLEAARRFTLDEVRSLCAQLPPPRVHRIHDVAQPRAAATLVPVVDIDGEAGVIITKRPATMLHHRGDWVFPGGRVDLDRDTTSSDAARREAEEELGIPAERVEIVGQLDTHGPIVTGFVIDVFVGVIDGTVPLAPDPREVSEVLTVPLSRFMVGASFAIGRLAPEHEPGPSADGAPTPSPRRDVAGGLASFALPNGDLLWGTQGEILFNLLDQLVALRTEETKGVPGDGVS
jgi:8-oxo-dGTP pyrophosphatase MutT (NUDIX family)